MSTKPRSAIRRDPLVHPWQWFRRAVPAWMRALIYMVIVGGAWAVVIPACLILIGPQHPPHLRALAVAWAGLSLFVLGTVLASWAGYDLIVRGKGTPFPLDPTTELVTDGVYRYVRNPQGIAMMLMVVGEAVAIAAPLLWLAVPLLFVYLEYLAAPWEHRQLSAAFGAHYLAYHARVPRWLPRLSPRGG